MLPLSMPNSSRLLISLVTLTKDVIFVLMKIVIDPSMLAALHAVCLLGYKGKRVVGDMVVIYESGAAGVVLQQGG